MIRFHALRVLVGVIAGVFAALIFRRFGLSEFLVGWLACVAFSVAADLIVGRIGE